MSSGVIYLDQGVDYLGFLNAKLRDLAGWSTLINELIQNADDADGATVFTLDITDTALVSENNGVFKACESVESRDCSFGGRPCDYHAFRRVASGHKRHEDNTTGAFGIGFISVYQITDNPILESGEWHWELSPGEPEERRIMALRKETPFLATRFTFPWAFDNTQVRQRLTQRPVTEADVHELPSVLADALRATVPFLRKLTRLELRRSGRPIATITCDRTEHGNEVLIDDGQTAQLYRRIVGDFDVQASVLRARHPSSIEPKRKSIVTVLVPLDRLPADGLYYAFLPTEQKTSLPVLINADFFPSSDRKRLLFGDDYQGQWNSAAVTAAAEALARALPALREALPASDIWRILDSMYALWKSGGSPRESGPSGMFWEKAEPVLRASQLIFTSTGLWQSPAGVRVLKSPDEESESMPVLQELEISLVHPDLRRYWNVLQAAGVRELTVDDVVSAFRATGMVAAISAEDCPRWLADANSRRLLTEQIIRLLDRAPASKKGELEADVLALPLCPTTERWLGPICHTRRYDAEAFALFREVTGLYALASDAPESLQPEIWDFRPSDLTEWLAGGSVAVTLSADETLVTAGRMVDWIFEQVDEWKTDAKFISTISTAPIWASSGQLRRLSDLCVPGSFSDPLNLAEFVDQDIVARWGHELRTVLFVRVLELDTYLLHLLPLWFQQRSDISPDTRRDVVSLIALHLGALRDRSDIASILRELPIVECTDGEFRPGDTVYFGSHGVRTILGDRVAIARDSQSLPESHIDALRWLGVESLPRTSEIVARIRDLIAEPVESESRAEIESMLSGISAHWAHYSEDSTLKILATLPWLPSRESRAWKRPADVFSIYNEYLFSTIGPFLDIGRDTQMGAAKVFDFLGVKSRPISGLVVQHLINLSSIGSQPNPEVYRFLSEADDHREIARLKTVACLWSGGRYHRPEKVFLGPHEFGCRRDSLESAWMQYAKLLETLGVKRAPEVDDARAVLLEIVADHQGNQSLSESDFEIVWSCWRMIASFLDELGDDWFEPLRRAKVVPNAMRVLERPDVMFFRDHPRLPEVFGAILASSVIDRPSGAASALSKIGVRALSSAVKTELVECDDVEAATAIEVLLRERLPLVRRILESSEYSAHAEQFAVVPKVFSASRLVVMYHVLLGARHLPSPEVHRVAALFDRQSGHLYVDRGSRKWHTAVARELVFALIPDASAAHLAAAVKDVLVAEDVLEASAGLDELGFAPAEVQHSVPQSSAPLAAPVGAATNGNLAGEGRSAVVGSTDEQPLPTAQVIPCPVADAVPVATAVTIVPPEPPALGGVATSGEESVVVRRENSPSAAPSKTAASPSPRGALRSYVLPPTNLDETRSLSDEQRARRHAADEAGIRAVLQTEQQAGRMPKKMDHFFEGYDIESYDSASSLIRVIEVKSLTGPWDGFGVGLSAPQFRCAWERAEMFWLYVVENAGQQSQRVHQICNPANRVDEFRFDNGWEGVAAAAATVKPWSILDVPNPEQNVSGE